MKFILGARSMKGCVLCELPKEKDPRNALIPYRGEHAYVLLNKYPYNSGHLMVLPYKHTSELSLLKDEELLDVQRLLRDSMEALKASHKPDGFNIGMNLGEAGGAGIRDHLHYHVVPRWNGDTNYMPLFADTKVLPESLEETFDRISPHFPQRRS